MFVVSRIHYTLRMHNSCHAFYNCANNGASTMLLRLCTDMSPFYKLVACWNPTFRSLPKSCFSFYTFSMTKCFGSAPSPDPMHKQREKCVPSPWVFRSRIQDSHHALKVPGGIISFISNFSALGWFLAYCLPHFHIPS